MRVRIIFRGLTLFHLDPPPANAGPNEFGALTAWLVSDPDHVGMPQHTHTPFISLIGKDAKPPNYLRTETKRRNWNDMRIVLKGEKPECHCMTADPSFLDYVPDVDKLGWGPRGNPRTNLVTRRVVIPHGTVRARDFIEWDWHGKRPVQIAYMKTGIVGYATNEVVVDIGDDQETREDANSRDQNYLALTSLDGTVEYERLRPRIGPGEWDEDIDPNTVELVFTNLPPRRRRAVFWGLHFQSLVKAAGYAPKNYSGDKEFRDFAAVASEYDPDEWNADQALGALYPFPYLIVNGSDTLPSLDGDVPDVQAPDKKPKFRVPPNPPGRGKGEGVGGPIPSHTTVGVDPHHGAMGAPTPPGDDPENREICPFARVMLNVPMTSESLSTAT